MNGLVGEYFIKKKFPNIMGLSNVHESRYIMGLSYVQRFPNIMGPSYVQLVCKIIGFSLNSSHCT